MYMYKYLDYSYSLKFDNHTPYHNIYVAVVMIDSSYSDVQVMRDVCRSVLLAMVLSRLVE